MLLESCKIHTSLHMVANPPNWHHPEVDKTESEHLEIDQYRFIVFILQNFIWTFASWTCCTSNNFQALAIHPNMSTPSNACRNFYPFCPPPRISWITILPQPSSESRASCCCSVGIFSSYIFAGYLLLSSSQSNPCICFHLDNNCLMLLSAIAMLSQSWAS